MVSAKEDRRVKYSKKVLKESLIALLRQKSIDKVSVTELCELSDLNRSTFYAHYTDPFDLLKQVEKELLDALDSYLDRFSVIDSKTETRHTLRLIFDYIAANAELCRVLLVENGDMAFQKKLLIYVQHLIVREPLTKAETDAELIDFVSRFCIDGCIGLVQKWLETGMLKSSEEMADIVIKLVYQGLSAYMNLKQ
jgi:AcrR family transcriptional regulator